MQVFLICFSILFCLSCQIFSTSDEPSEKTIVLPPPPIVEQVKTDTKVTLDQKTENYSNVGPIALEKYAGKYAKEERWDTEVSNIGSIILQTIEQIAQHTGFAYQEKGYILIRFFDIDKRRTEYSTDGYVVSRLKDGQFYYEVGLCAEVIWTRENKLSKYLPRLLMKAILQRLGKYDSIGTPEWFILGSIAYTTEIGQSVLEETALRALENNLNLNVLWEGLAKSKPLFPEAEGYLGFRFIVEYFHDGKSRLKTLFNQVLWQGKDWQTQWNEVLQMNFIEWQEKAKNYARSVFQSYQSLALVYRQALRLYLQEDYLEAIPQLKKLTFEAEGTYIIGNVWFWLAMSYYKNRQYSTAEQYFHRSTTFSFPNHYLAESYYRQALCRFHQNQLAQAIQQLHNFIRDYPYHPLFPSAYYFLGQSWELQKKFKNAVFCYEKMLEIDPNHNRAQEAKLSIIQLSRELYWVQTGLLYCDSLLHTPTLKKSEKEKVMDYRASFESMEQTNLPIHIEETYQKELQQFSEYSSEKKKTILQEIMRLGKISVPWTMDVLPIFSEEEEKIVIQGIQQIPSKYSLPLLWKILQKNPNQAKIIFLTLLRLKIPTEFIENMLTQEISTLPKPQQNYIREQWNNILWDTTPTIRQALPSLLLELNGIDSSEPLEQQQCTALSKLARITAQEPIAVLIAIAKKGSHPARFKALEYLIAWQNKQAIPIFLELLENPASDIQILAVQGLTEFEEYPIMLYQNLLQRPNVPISLRQTIVSALAQADQIESWHILAQTLSDPDLEIRQTIKDHILKKSSPSIGKILCAEFIKESQPTYFYNDLAELIEKISKLKIGYDPKMNAIQRKEVIAPIVQRWQK